MGFGPIKAARQCLAVPCRDYVAVHCVYAAPSVTPIAATSKATILVLIKIIVSIPHTASYLYIATARFQQSRGWSNRVIKKETAMPIICAVYRNRGRKSGSHTPLTCSIKLNIALSFLEAQVWRWRDKENNSQPHHMRRSFYASDVRIKAHDSPIPLVYLFHAPMGTPIGGTALQPGIRRLSGVAFL